ncbi:MAG: hypothetical protein LEGION0398_MBIBDBAK_00178 [Legionellaceae bacterium]
MKWALYQSKLSRLLKQRHILVQLLFAEMGLIGLLIMMLFYAFMHERIVITPPLIEKRFWVNQHSVSVEYLSEMSAFFASLRFNLTPANVANQRDTLLRYTDSRYYNTLKTGLVAEADNILKEHITLAFYPVDIAVNTTSLIAKVTGDMTTQVGNVLLPVKRETYLIRYTYHDGRLLVASFTKVKNHA